MTETPPPPPPVQAVSPHLNYPESLDSSPRSRNTDSWDEPLATTLAGRLRLMCSYGGHIVPRPHDKTLCYVCGETRIVVVDRHTSLSDLSSRLSKTLLNGRPFTLKYQLPNEDLDSLISVTTDEDLENMIDEYDRTASGNSNSTAKPSRLRLFLFPVKPEVSQSIGPILESSNSSEDWFFNALNGAGLLNRGYSDSASVNCLLGLDDVVGVGVVNNLDSGSRDVEGSQIGSIGNGKNGKFGHDVHSVPDSPMIETTSSFGSTSSSPSLANLPPIRVHVEESGGGIGGVRVQDQKMGIEEQFSQMSVGGVGIKQQDDGFMVMSSPPPPLPTTIVASVASAVPVNAAAVVGEYSNRVISDDERSDHGAPVGHRKPLPPPQPQSLTPQLQQKSSGIVGDVPSPDSVSSDSSLNNPMSRSKPMIYQDQVVQISSTGTRLPGIPADPKLNISDQNTRVHMQQQVQESGYVLQSHYDQHLQQQQQQQIQQQQQLQQHQQQQQLQQQQHQQLQQQQQLQQHQQQQQHPPQPQQFIHAGTHYIQQHPTGAVPMPAFYSVYPPQQHHGHHGHQLEQQYPVYYVPARQAQAYSNLPVQQSTISEVATAISSGRPQTPTNPALVTPAAYNHPLRNAPITKTEMAASSAYKQTTTAAQSLVQVPSSQHQQQYVGYSQGYSHIQHPSQSVTPTSATANYAYEFPDPSHTQSQIYYTQPLAPSQYQPMPAASVMLPENSAQLPTDNNIKQQMRTSQAL